ncbi:MAG: hypothetical protein ABJA62_07850 [Luteimonas sp.]
MKPIRKHHVIVLGALVSATGFAHDAPPRLGNWGDPQPVVAINTPAAEGCPIESGDGRSLYFASSRAAPGAQGKLDLYRARRDGRRGPHDAGWGEAENLGAPVNTPEFDYCPTPLAGGWLMYVSSQQTDDDCYPGAVPPPPPPGGPSAGDIYITKETRWWGWLPPLNLGCNADGPNTAGAEFSPSLVSTREGAFLYFSSNGYPDSMGQDIYVSQLRRDGSFGPGTRVTELSTAADDRMPNVRRDGLEIVFSSNRASADPFNQDIYVATRPDTGSPWSLPKRIDNPQINTAASETRASLSGDGQRLYFGRKLDINDPGDVFFSKRVMFAGHVR